MNYKTLQQIANMLDSSLLDTIKLVNEVQPERKIVEGKVNFSVDDMFDNKLERFEKDSYALDQNELANIIGFYLDGTEENENNEAKKLTYVIDTLWDERPITLKNVTNQVDDLFYEIVRNRYPGFYGAGTFKEPELTDLGPTILSPCKPVKRISYAKARRITDLRHKAQATVDRVSTFFEIDLPETINMSKNRKHYASIKYKRKMFLAEENQGYKRVEGMSKGVRDVRT